MERSDSSTEKRSDNMNNIPYRLSSRDSFSSSLRSSHKLPTHVTDNLPLVASLLASRPALLQVQERERLHVALSISFVEAAAAFAVPSAQ